jgi:hypothetical protein
MREEKKTMIRKIIRRRVARKTRSSLKRNLMISLY